MKYAVHVYVLAGDPLVAFNLSLPIEDAVLAVVQDATSVDTGTSLVPDSLGNYTRDIVITVDG
jgi:hypothetical protein